MRQPYASNNLLHKWSKALWYWLFISRMRRFFLFYSFPEDTMFSERLDYLTVDSKPQLNLYMVGTGEMSRESQRMTTYDRVWRQACQTAGLPGKILHDFRCASEECVYEANNANRPIGACQFSRKRPTFLSVAAYPSG